jgi:long-chain acyl-CoA synthetase
MNIDLDLFRRDIRVSSNSPMRISAIDISPDFPRRTIVFLHGFGGQATQWQFQLQKFSLENRVIALDLPGHGRSDPLDSNYSMEEVVKILDSALAGLEVDMPVTLVSHSFGGAIATEYTLHHPERVERMVLAAAAGEYRLNPLYRLAFHLPNALLRVASFFTRNWLGASPDVLKSWYVDNLTGWKGWDLFPQINLPVMVIRGHRDRVLEKPAYERVARSIPGADEVDIGASGHMVMIERRDAVNRAIERFLETETKKTWRDSVTQRPFSSRDSLRRQRPWLAHYQKDVPYTIGIPRVPTFNLLRSSAMRFPHRTAVEFEGGSLSFRKLNGEVNRFANALLKLGILKGARVALLLPNVPHLVIGFYGTLKAGGVAVFLTPLESPEELTRQLRESESSVLVTLRMWSGLARQVQAGTGIPHIVLVDGGEYLPIIKKWISFWRLRELDMPGALRWTRWLSGLSRKAPQVGVSPEDLAVIQFTGGTTAEAKGVMLSHRNLVANAIQTRQWMPDAVEGGECFLSVVPISHIYGLTAAMNLPVSIGATMILKSSFNVIDVVRAIRRHHPTIFPGVPTMYLAINNVPGVRKYKLGSIRACISGSAPLPVEVQEAFEKLTKGRLVEGYGLTEASPVTHANPLQGMRKVGSIGIPVPSTEAIIVDLKHGKKEEPVGHIGELAVRGPQVMMGYWKNQAASRTAITKDGWLMTGDVAVMDTDGFFRIIARKADMWYPEKPGNPAFPRDVEEVLYEIPQVKEAVVVAIAGAPVAFIISQKERPTSNAVTAYCQRRLPPHLVPRLVIFVDEFPRSFIGKVLRRELARRYEQGQPK